jgi:predicted AlkP superfamily phosphohydrolase/phosphomutase
MPKALVVGLDGATFDVIDLLIQQGELPHLARLRQQGFSKTLRSTVPPITPAAWTSFFTGKNPGMHGIFDFQDLDKTSYEFKTIRTDRHREKTLWQLLGEQDLRSLVIDVPFTFPPQPLNGLMLTGYGTPMTDDTEFTYPENLAELVPESLRSEIRVGLPSQRFDRSTGFIDEWRQVMAGRRDLLMHLIQEQPWDLFMVVFSITDNMAHVFWTYFDPAHPNYHRDEALSFREAFLDAYRQSDAILGELMAAAGEDTTTLVISDHGFGSVRPRQYIFQRLMAGGYIQRQAGESKSLKSRAAELAANTYMRFPFLREWVKGLRPGAMKAVRKSVRAAGLVPMSGSDFAHSKVIVTNFGLRLWINDSERFSAGKVDPAEKEALIDELIAFLKADRDPENGKPIIQDVHRGRELYDGPAAEQGPDLVIEYNNHYSQQAQARSVNRFSEGGHTLEGILLAGGRAVNAGSASDPAMPLPTLVDLAPTLLHLLGQDIPPDMDGRLLTELLDPEWLNQHPVRYGEQPAQYEAADGSGEMTAEEAESVDDQLRRLGYI